MFKYNATSRTNSKPVFISRLSIQLQIDSEEANLRKRKFVKLLFVIF